jgi:hypothetical protein
MPQDFSDRVDERTSSLYRAPQYSQRGLTVGIAGDYTTEKSNIFPQAQRRLSFAICDSSYESVTTKVAAKRKTTFVDYLQSSLALYTYETLNIE